MEQTIVCSLCCLSFVVLAGCGDGFQSKVNSQGGGDSGFSNLTLNSQTQEVLQNHCSSCHNIADLASSAYVVPGDARDSELYQRIAGGSMPPTSPLSSGDTQVIANWIESLGAVVPTPTPAITPTPVATPTPTPISTPTVATFTLISQSILKKRCVGCHGGDGGYSFDNYSHTMKGVVAKNPAKSPLYTAIAQGRMPRGAKSLTKQEIQEISDWIKAGAPNN